MMATPSITGMAARNLSRILTSFIPLNRSCLYESSRNKIDIVEEISPSPLSKEESFLPFLKGGEEGFKKSYLNDEALDYFQETISRQPGGG
jgi:hypothetical protein